MWCSHATNYALVYLVVRYRRCGTFAPIILGRKRLLNPPPNRKKIKKTYIYTNVPNIEYICNPTTRVFVPVFYQHFARKYYPHFVVISYPKLEMYSRPELPHFCEVHCLVHECEFLLRRHQNKKGGDPGPFELPEASAVTVSKERNEDRGFLCSTNERLCQRTEELIRRTGNMLLRELQQCIYHIVYHDFICDVPCLWDCSSLPVDPVVY